MDLRADQGGLSGFELFRWLKLFYLIIRFEVLLSLRFLLHSLLAYKLFILQLLLIVFLLPANDFFRIFLNLLLVNLICLAPFKLTLNVQILAHFNNATACQIMFVFKINLACLST